MTEAPINTEITQDDKLWAALSYVFSPVIPIVILLMEDKKSRPYLKFHAVQALATIIVLYILATVTVGCGSILLFAMLYWAYQAYQGQDVRIPVITDFIKKQGWV
ncbi:MAG: hypothetical protein JW726_00330 [Anaerolineales bacterium]|nr:hypothetical protein [Anaerolineales bacterium]